MRQRRTGLGWRSLAELSQPAEEPAVGLLEVDEMLEEIRDGKVEGRAK